MVSPGKDEKKELMEKMQPPKGSKPIDLAQHKGDRWEKDPVTGGTVLIRDPDFKGTASVVPVSMHGNALTQLLRLP